MRPELRRKLTSRKLWLAIAGFAAGLIVALGGSEGTASTVSGCIMSGASVVAYIVGEGLADSGAGTVEDCRSYTDADKKLYERCQNEQSDRQDY